MPESEFSQGTVKWFNSSKGYGFIVCNGKDIFLHSKRLRESCLVNPTDGLTIVPVEGQKLKFKILDGPRGAYAAEISKI